MKFHYTRLYIQNLLKGKKKLKPIILVLLVFCSGSVYSQEMLSYNLPTSATIEHSNKLNTSKKIVKKLADNTMYIKGTKDADRYYADYTPYAGGFVSGLVLPPAGLVTTIIISAHAPKEFNLGIPDELKQLKANPEYFKGYLDQASKRKKQRTWAGFATGTAFFVSGMLMFGYLDWK